MSVELSDSLDRSSSVEDQRSHLNGNVGGTDATVVSVPRQMSPSGNNKLCDPESVVFNTGWSFWCATPGKNSGWEMKDLFSVDNVAAFWCHVNSMKAPSEFSQNAVEVALFRKGVNPDWELEPCKNGGRWSARLERVQSADSLDQSWFRLVLAALGEVLVSPQMSSKVLGVAYSGKGSHTRRVAVWTSTREQNEIMEIGHKFKDALRLSLSDKDIGEMLFHDFTSGNKAFAVIANTGKKDKRSLKSTKSSGSVAGSAEWRQ